MSKWTDEFPNIKRIEVCIGDPEIIELAFCIVCSIEKFQEIDHKSILPSKDYLELIEKEYLAYVLGKVETYHFKFNDYYEEIEKLPEFIVPVFSVDKPIVMLDRLRWDISKNIDYDKNCHRTLFYRRIGFVTPERYEEIMQSKEKLCHQP